MKESKSHCSYLKSCGVKSAALMGVSLASFAASPVSFAQSDAASVFAEEIVVTARKRPESSQDVPIAISAFSGKSLEARGIQQTDDIAAFTPNLTLQNNPSFGGGTNIAAIYIRGIGQFDFLGSIEPGVGLYVDGVYLARSVGAIMDLVEIEQVEVLRGPQGTLFGRNTIGGAINITTKKPNDELSVSADAAFGDDSRVELSASVNVPITDTFFVKASTGYFNRDGYVQRLNENTLGGEDLGNQDTWIGRIQARWEPTTNLSIDVAFDYTRDRSNGPAFVVRGALFDSQVFNPNGQPLAPPPLPATEGGPAFPDLAQLGGTPVGNGFEGSYAGLPPEVLGAILPPGTDPNTVFYQLNVRERALLNGAPATFVAPLDAPTDNFLLLHNYLQAYGPGGTPGVCMSAPFQDYAASGSAEGCYGPQLWEQAIGEFNNGSNDPSFSETDVWGGSLDINYDFGDIQVRSITAYRELSSQFATDFDATSVSIQFLEDDFEQTQFSQELQVLGQSFDGRLNWIAGLYYFNEDVDNRNDVSFTPVSVRSGGVISNKSFAAFAQGTFDITDQLSITLGARFTKDDKTFNSDPYQYILSSNVGPAFVGGFDACPGAETAAECPANIQLFAPVYDGSAASLLEDFSNTAQPVPLATDGDENLIPLPLGIAGPLSVYETRVSELSEEEFNPYISIAYKWTDDIMTYASFSQGFKSGGFTQRVFPPLPAIPSVDSEKVNVYEVGFKSTILDGMARINGAVFRTDYDDIQVQGFTLATGIAPVYFNLDSGARMQGFELDYALFLNDGWYIEGGVGYVDAQYNEEGFPEGAIIGVTADSEFERVSKWTLNAGIQKTFELGSMGTFSPRVDWSYRSKFYNDASNVEEIAQPGYSVFNSTFMWRDESDVYSITAGVINILKQDYIHTAVWNGNAPSFTVVPNRGREWYIRAGVDF